MISSVAEFNAARALVDREVERARLLGQRQPRQVLVGAMLEVPSLAFMLPQLMRSADFVSIGSNDLLSFAFAADRTNPRVARRYDGLNPAALTMIGQIVRSAKETGGELSLCGEMAGRPDRCYGIDRIRYSLAFDVAWQHRAGQNDDPEPQLSATSPNTSKSCAAGPIIRCARGSRPTPPNMASS